MDNVKVTFTGNMRMGWFTDILLHLAKDNPDRLIEVTGSDLRLMYSTELKQRGFIDANQYYISKAGKLFDIERADFFSLLTAHMQAIVSETRQDTPSGMQEIAFGELPVGCRFWVSDCGEWFGATKTGVETYRHTSDLGTVYGEQMPIESRTLVKIPR